MDYKPTRYEMGAENIKYKADDKATIPELQTYRDVLVEISPRTRQELKGEEISKELEVPRQQLNDDD